MDVEAIVVGAGVIGLAIARRIAKTGRSVFVIEAEERIGAHTSSRNSEVIHAGIYYPEGSLKAQLCVAGRKALYAYCDARHIPLKRTGKLIVAASEAESAALQSLYQRGQQNGVGDLQWLSAGEARALEPEVECVAAILSPSSGIVDSHAYMLSLQGEAEAKGAQCVFRTKVEDIEVIDDGFEVQTRGAESMAVTSSAVFNCAGFDAQIVAAKVRAYPRNRVPPRFLAKGNYFSVSGPTPFRHLVYPMPVAGGLGVHVTLDLAGRMRLGPDLHWVEKVDYTADSSMIQAFYNSVSTFWPSVLERDLSWTYSGIRPKTSGPGEPPSDFLVDGPEDHGIAGLVNLFGIESPGLTSSLALAELAVQKLGWS
ncbi:MAG TPA: NAD(P)/FAD-dependent oxidoreductase [Dongiaceae bacterium]|nr:NAD(P)/FAD-dependent oxidoreductase [Dongiaceae bacterium]